MLTEFLKVQVVILHVQSKANHQPDNLVHQARTAILNNSIQLQTLQLHPNICPRADIHTRWINLDCRLLWPGTVSLSLRPWRLGVARPSSTRHRPCPGRTTPKRAHARARFECVTLCALVIEAQQAVVTIW